MALVKGIAIATTLTDMTSIGGGRQVMIAGSNANVVFDIYGAKDGSSAARKLCRMTVDQTNGGMNFALKGDYTAFMKYDVVSGTPGGSLDIYLQGSLRSF